LLDLRRRQQMRLALIQSHSYRRQVEYTSSGLIDRLIFILSSLYDVDFIDEETGTMHLSHPYLEHAHLILFRINVFKSPPPFIIHEKDIPQDVIDTFNEIGKTASESIITDVVRTVLENVNPEYFHVNGIYGKVRWEIEK